MALTLSVLDTFTDSAAFDESAAEIVAFTHVDTSVDIRSAGAGVNNTGETPVLLVVNGETDSIDLIDMSDPSNLTAFSFGDIGLPNLSGSPNSVATSGTVVAVALEAANPGDPGTVLLADRSDFSSDEITVGVLPDMVTFTPDGTKVLVANEGEPVSTPGAQDDPLGSISIIDISNGVEDAPVVTLDFTSFDAQREALVAAGVRLFPGVDPSQDFEPEFITVSPDGTTAYAALQENNAIAVIDIENETITEILPLGLKDHSLPGNGLDASDDDGAINIQNWPVFGMYMPDSIAAYDFGGQTFIVTANEGDDRGEDERIGDLVNTEDENLPALDPTAFPNAATLQQDANLGRLGVSTIDGDTDDDGDYDQLFAYGSRSFSIFDSSGTRVFDSGDAFEQITAQFAPNFFNASNDNNDFDNRSDNKGPEPEGVTLGEIAGRTYAFIGLERFGGIMVYDVTNPNQAGFVQYINNRDFFEDVELQNGVAPQTVGPDAPNPDAGDLGPEGLLFISAADSPNGNPLLVVANEVSGTTTVFNIALEDVARRFGPDLTGGTAGRNVRGNFRNNRLFGDANNNRIFGVGGNDFINARNGNDNANGGNGADTVIGGNGNDRISGNNAGDILQGGAGDDLLLGGNGNDRLIGGNGNDVLIGNQGSDTLTGGAGRDYFRYTTFNDGGDIISDFNPNLDVIDLFPLTNRNAFSANTGIGKFRRFVTLQQVGNSTRVVLDRDGNAVGSTNILIATLTGVQASDLSASNFVL